MRNKAALILGLLSLSLLLCLRPAAVAQTVELDQGWQLLTDASATLRISTLPEAAAAGWRKVEVGVSWNAQFDDLRDYMGVAWYRSSFQVPSSAVNGHVLLRFGAVDYFSEVFVNGTPAGTHEGGYTPFVFDITGLVRAGENQLVVRVVDPPMNAAGEAPRFPDMPYNEIPHGKQNWYVQTGGIWQGVQVEFRPKIYVERVHVTPSIDGSFKAEVTSVGGQSPFTLVVRDRAGAVVFAREGKLTGEQTEIAGKVADVETWSTASPALYTVELALGNGDSIRERFGFRKFEANEGKLYLNGKPLYMRAALDQDFYPATIYTPPSESYVREQMLKAKQLGLNLLRCHIKVCDPMYLNAADEVGMLVWYEIPSWNDEHHFTPRAAERGEKILAEMVERDWNHPAIAIQSIINETWGADLKEASQREWLKAAYTRAKQLTVPLGRLIVDNSACCDGFHLKSDVDDFHQYYSMPDNAAKWDAWVKDFASRPAWSFSKFGDAERTGREPLIVSEFGNWGLPLLPARLPWWFPRDFGGRAVTRPAGVLDRFHEHKLDSLFKNYSNLAIATQWHQFESLKHEIETMRAQAPIQGYVITELTDINWEANGLMDMWRNPKAYARRLADIQQDDVILAEMPKHAAYAGESLRIKLLGSHYSSANWTGASIYWRTSTGESGIVPVSQEVAPTAVGELGTFTLTASTTGNAISESISIELISREGKRLAENSHEIQVFPPARTASAAISVNGLLASALSMRGYHVTAGTPSPSSLLVANGWNIGVEQHVRSGGSAIVLLDNKTALPPHWSLKTVPRAGSDLDGNWVTNFNWVRNNVAPFRGVSLKPVLGFEAATVMPELVIQGIASRDYSDVLSGIFYGWINDNAALMVQGTSGKGRVILTTLRFDSYGSDAYATSLLDSMIHYATSGDFAPTLRLDGGNDAGNGK